MYTTNFFKPLTSSGDKLKQSGGFCLPGWGILPGQFQREL